MKKAIGLLWAGLVLGACAPAVQAADEGRGITGPELVAILQEAGYKARLDKDEDGDPRVHTAMGGVNASVYFYDCEKDRCGSLQFLVGLGLEQGSTPAVVGRYNRDYRYASAYLDEESDPFLKFDFEVLHTRHAAHIASQLDIWEDLLADFLRETGYLKDHAHDDAPAPGDDTRASLQ